jgi:NADPH2 dehydrogenase
LRYFRYPNLESLSSEVRKLKLDKVIRFETDLSTVWRGVKIGKRRTWNSFGIHPLEGCDGTPDGRPGELTFRRYKRFGAGGASLIWFETTATSPDGRSNPRQLLINDSTKPNFEGLVQATREAHKQAFGSDEGLVLGIQLTHSGRMCFPKPVIAQHNPLLDRMQKIPEDHKPISDDELERLEDSHVAAAETAYEAGFDFVDVKQCHGYLLSELLASKTRPGRYGGSLENRARIALNIVKRIRNELGRKLAIASRMNVYDGVPFVKNPETNEGTPAGFPVPYRWGFGCDESDPMTMDLSEPKRLAGMLQEAGVSLISITMGIGRANDHIIRPWEAPPFGGYESPEHPLVGVARHISATKEIKEAVPELIVVGAGYSWLRHFLPYAAEVNIRNGWVDVVALGRGALAYPDYVKDLREWGAMNPRRACCTDSMCTALMRASVREPGRASAGCALRDKVYREIYRSVIGTKAARSRT